MKLPGGIAIGLLALTIGAPALRAQDAFVGTWIKQSTTNSPAGLMMTAEPWGKGGIKLIYRLAGQPGNPVMMTVESPLDGSDAAVIVNGKPSGETMGIKRVDGRHWTAALKMNGKPFATSSGGLSADGKTLTVENNVTSAGVAGMPLGKILETWTKQ